MKKWLRIGFWSLFTILVVVGMIYAGRQQKEQALLEPTVFIKVNGQDAFLTKEDLLQRLRRKGLIYPGQIYEKLNLPEIEKYIRSMSEVKNVKVYADLGEAWNIDLEVRRPIARIFNSQGESFYLDDEGFTMAPSYLYTARVVVVNGFIPDSKHTESVFDIINNDTLKSIRVLDDIYRISNYVCNDPFLRAQIGQIHREKDGDFVLIPQVGGHRIVFGSANSDEDVADKLKKLRVFYEDGLPYEGWNTYQEINLKYKNQIVCKKKE